MTASSSNSGSESISYEKSGVNINTADAAKRDMAKTLATSNPRVLNTVGAFASLYDFNFPEIKSPVLVVKMEEPGTKQLLAAQHGRLSDIGFDLINHLINDTVVMGARPLVVLDTIICGKLEKADVVGLVKTMSKACQDQGCNLVGGETSEQPRVIPVGTYILSACCVGVVDREKVIDGSKIGVGDVVLGISSNGVHTNGYTLVRSLLDRNPKFAEQKIGSSTVLDEALRPHLCYNKELQVLFQKTTLHGLAHITGGGVVDNLGRIIPEGLQAEIDLGSIRVLDIFKAIAREGNVPEADMLRTFNLGVGLIAVAPAASVAAIVEEFAKSGVPAYQIGRIEQGAQKVKVSGKLSL
ncbi:MAG: phosphoribosylformylglycinamidine cyclo-ligase [Deltaproteobacteria bacterium]|nr:phosphoribosylformylglycinamidine cyclo-ligase [Deltaproteobacteria bacterium]